MQRSVTLSEKKNLKSNRPWIDDEQEDGEMSREQEKVESWLSDS